jgi:hypothetical protein
MDLTYARKDLYVPHIWIFCGPDNAKQCLSCTGRAVYIKPHARQAFADLPDLFF